MKLVSADEVEKIVRAHLIQQGYSLTNAQRKHGETGCDVIAARDRARVFVEVIGFQSAPPIRSREFYECFFRAISRDQGKPNDRLIMALPKRFADGMARRKRQYGLAWEKIGKAFPHLEIWYVDVNRSSVEERPWADCELDPVPSPLRFERSRKWRPRTGTIGFLVREMLLSGRTYAAIHKAVRREFPDSKFNRQHFTWYKSQLQQSITSVPS